MATRINYWFKDTVNVHMFDNTVYVHIARKNKSGVEKTVSLTAPAFRSLIAKSEEILHIVEDYEMVAATEAADREVQSHTAARQVTEATKVQNHTPARQVTIERASSRFTPYKKTGRPTAASTVSRPTAAITDSRRSAVCSRPQPIATTVPSRPANSPPRFHPQARSTTPFPYHGDGGRLTPPLLIPLQPRWERDYDDVFEPAPSTYAPQGYQPPSLRGQPEEEEEEQQQMQEQGQWDHQHHQQQQQMQEQQSRGDIAHQVDTQLRLLRDQTNVGPSVRVTIPPSYPGGNHS